MDGQYSIPTPKVNKILHSCGNGKITLRLTRPTGPQIRQECAFLSCRCDPTLRGARLRSPAEPVDYAQISKEVELKKKIQRHDYFIVIHIILVI